MSAEEEGVTETLNDAAKVRVAACRAWRGMWLTRDMVPMLLTALHSCRVCAQHSAIIHGTLAAVTIVPGLQMRQPTLQGGAEFWARGH